MARDFRVVSVIRIEVNSELPMRGPRLMHYGSVVCLSLEPGQKLIIA